MNTCCCERGSRRPRPEVQKRRCPDCRSLLHGSLMATREPIHHKPSGIAGKETVLRVHLIPAFGAKRLDAISSEDVARLKSRLVAKAPKTVNNVLTVLNVLLKTAVEWHVIDQVPCSVRLVRVPQSESTFHDFTDYERLVSAAQTLGEATYLIVLLGAEAGLRCGEIMALEWGDVDVTRHRLSVARSEWEGPGDRNQGGPTSTRPADGTVRSGPAPSSAPARPAGRLRYPGRVVHAEARPDSGGPGDAAGGAQARRRPYAAAYVLLAPGDERGSRQGHPGTGGAPGPVHDAALHASESRDLGCGESGSSMETDRSVDRGEIVEAAGPDS